MKLRLRFFRSLWRWVAMVVSLVLCQQVAAQSLGIVSLFKPGIRVGATAFPSAAVNDSVDLGMNVFRGTAIIPLGGNVKVDWKKLDAKVSQSFLNVGAGVRQVELSDNDTRYLYHFSLGITGARAGIGEGIWAYTAHVGMLHDYGVGNRYRPFAAAGLMRIKVKGVNKQNFFGAGAAYNRFFIPVPIWGLRRRIVKKVHIMMLLPIQVDVSWKATKTLHFGWWNRWNNFFSTIHYPPPPGVDSVVEPGRWMTYRSLQTSAVVQYKVGKSAKLIAEGGLSYFRNAQFDSLIDRENVFSDAVAPAPFVRFAVHVNIGKSPLGSQLFGVDF